MVLLALHVAVTGVSMATAAAPQGPATQTTAPPELAPHGCAEHIELYSAVHIADQLDSTADWAMSHYRTTLWQDKPSPDRDGRQVGELLPGARAVVVRQDGTHYFVRSLEERTLGWLHERHVWRTVWLDTATGAPCQSKSPGPGNNPIW